MPRVRGMDDLTWTRTVAVRLMIWLLSQGVEEFGDVSYEKRQVATGRNYAPLTLALWWF